MGKKQITAIQLLKNYKGKESGRALYSLLLETMTQGNAYITVKGLVESGYLKVTKCHRNGSKYSMDNTYEVTQKALALAVDTLAKRRAVKVDHNVIRFDRKQITCESSGCQHAEGDVCTCACGGVHHGVAVKLSPKQKVQRIKVLSAELAALLAA